jgi:ABC superfamily ATP binding cassette transporter, ABC protein
MITGLIGVNGSGKTTHLKYLNHKTPGRYLPDYPNIPIEISACELLLRIGAMRKINNIQERAQLLCSTLLIDGAFDRPISTYSAGNYKKTALATLLLDLPRILYLDEPLETIDMVSQKTITNILHEMSSLGTNIIISTQDISLCMNFDRIKVFSKLEIIAEGKPKDILGNNPLECFFKLSNVSIPSHKLKWLS